jgi:hypothetical protein
MFQCIYIQQASMFIYAIWHLVNPKSCTFLIAGVMVSSINMGSNEQIEPCAAASEMYGASIYMLSTQGGLV